MTDSLQIYIQQIQDHIPDLVIKSASLITHGQYNDVVAINAGMDNGTIFRFAKYPDDAKTLHQETVILQHIQGYISLAIPNPIYQSKETEKVGESFMGYPMIAGETLQYKAFQTITNPQARNALALQLATFLGELHRIPVEHVIPLKLPLLDQREAWIEMYTQFRDKLYIYMRPDAQQEVTAHFESFLNNAERYTFEPTLRHGDFGPGNLVYNPKTQALTGVIDFGGAGLGDPAIDFAGLYTFADAEFCQRCCEIYPEIETCLDRTNFYRGTFALQEALFGIENGDKEAFENGIETYR